MREQSLSLTDVLGEEIAAIQNAADLPSLLGVLGTNYMVGIGLIFKINCGAQSFRVEYLTMQSNGYPRSPVVLPRLPHINPH